MKEITTPLTPEIIRILKAKDRVYLTGEIYTARDRAHKKLVELIQAGKPLPFRGKGQVIYYCGPIIKKGKLGPCGPTTSSRMDNFIEPLLKVGIYASIGKGKRSPWVREFLKKYQGVYFVTYGGCAAYLSEFVKEHTLIAFPELGAEAIYRFRVKKFPLIVGIDAKGRDIYQHI